jgi:predicted transglutaminase-like cysteine proteinase
MFGRVAAWSVAVFLAVSPTRSSVETDTLAPFPDPTAVVSSWAPWDAGELPGLLAEADTASLGALPTLQDSAGLQSPAARFSALDPAEPAVTTPPIAEPFGLTAARITGGDVLAKWSTVQARIRAESKILARCSDGDLPCPEAAKNFLGIIDQGRARTGRARIGVINRAINLAIEPMSDLAQWGVPDRWSPPLETFTTGHGDCEDYAIAKYVALTAAGVAAADVKLVIVRNTAANEDHAVATARLDGHWVVLDNRSLALVADADMRDAVPLFVLDSAGVRTFSAPMLISAGPTPDPASL